MMSQSEKPERFVVLMLGIGLATAALIILVTMDSMYRHHMTNGMELQGRSENVFTVSRKKFFQIVFFPPNMSIYNSNSSIKHRRQKREAVAESAGSHLKRRFQPWQPYKLGPGLKNAKDLPKLILRSNSYRPPSLDLSKKQTNEESSAKVFRFRGADAGKSRRDEMLQDEIDDDDDDETTKISHDKGTVKSDDDVQYSEENKRREDPADKTNAPEEKRKSKTRYIKHSKPRHLKVPSSNFHRIVRNKNEQRNTDHKFYDFFLTNFSEDLANEFPNRMSLAPRAAPESDRDKLHWCFSALELICAVVGAVALTTALTLTVLMLCFCCCFRRKKRLHTDINSETWWTGENGDGSGSCYSFEGNPKSEQCQQPLIWKGHPMTVTKSYVQLEQNDGSPKCNSRRKRPVKVPKLFPKTMADEKMTTETKFQMPTTRTIKDTTKPVDMLTDQSPSILSSWDN